jgi:hypothetical protein
MPEWLWILIVLILLIAAAVCVFRDSVAIGGAADLARARREEEERQSGAG